MGDVRNQRVTGGRHTIKLAPGIALRGDGEPPRDMLLVLAAGEVHLNRHALAILELCDGSRSRDHLIIDAMLRAPGVLRASDVADFLDSARSRGWIVEG
jgi:pyrroloquinoline quinone biosynthesis protein D